MAYRSSDTYTNKEFLEFLKSNVAANNRDEANTSWNYYQRANYILDLNDYLRASTREKIEVGFGNVMSGVVFVLNTVNDKKILEFLRNLFKKLNMNYHDVYFTSINKSSNSGLNIDVLNKELNTIKPSVVIAIGNDIVQKIGYKCTMYTPRYDLFTEMLDLMDKEDIMDEDKVRLQGIKNEIWNDLKYMVKGYNPIG